MNHTELLLGQAYFWVCAAMAVAGAIFTVIAKNPIRGAMGLLMTILAIAGIYLALHAQFLAAIQLIVYAGAIVVLFLFVIMLLGPAAQPPRDRRGLGPRIAGSLGLVLVAVGGVITMMVWDGKTKVPAFPVVRGGEGSIESMAHEVFVNGIVPFELSSALLIVAVVGAVAVARGRQGEQNLKGLSAQEQRMAAAFQPGGVSPSDVAVSTGHLLGPGTHVPVALQGGERARAEAELPR
jgi:NADH-quinone oxidoreductase subunit J